jgi:diguanylate cyclase
MSVPSSTAWVIAAVGIAHFTIGWIAGRHWPIRRSDGRRSERGMTKDLRDLGRRLREAVAEMSEDISRHSRRMQSVTRDLATVGAEEDGSAVQAVPRAVAEILRHNSRLQGRLAAAEDQLRQQARQIESWMTEARSDPLTGLPNRRAFHDALAQRIAQWRRTRVPFCLMVADIDHFKSVNDQHGHPAGDFVLRCVGELLEYTLRRMDLIARVGGEEFAAILPNTGVVEGCRAAERTRKAVAAHDFCLDDLHLRLTVSLGVAMATSDDDAASLVQRADEALYAAKRAGRNNAHFHTGDSCRLIEQTSLPDETSPPPAGASSGPSAPAAPPIPGEPAYADMAELGAACTGLRERLATFLGDGPPERCAAPPEQ